MSEETGSATERAQEEASSGKHSRHRRRKGGSGGTGNRDVAKPSLNMAELRELAELVNEHGFTDFEFENANIRIRLSKMTATPIVHQTVQQPMTAAPLTSNVPQATSTESQSAQTEVLAAEA